GARRGAAPWEPARARREPAGGMDARGRRAAAIDETRSAIGALAPLGARLDLARARALLEAWEASPAGPSVAKGRNGLTAREIEVLRLISTGLSNQEIGDRLFISEHTVHRHVANVLGKLEVSSRSAAVAQAGRLGLL